MGTKFEEEWKEYFEYLVFYNILLMLIVAVNSNKKDLYKKYQREIKQSGYKRNKYTKELLNQYQGKIKTFVLLNIIIKSYYLSMPIVKLFLKRR